MQAQKGNNIAPLASGTGYWVAMGQHRSIRRAGCRLAPDNRACAHDEQVIGDIVVDAIADIEVRGAR